MPCRISNAALLLFLLCLCGCSGDSSGRHDDYADGWVAIGQSRSRTTVNEEIYLAPNTEMTVTQRRPLGVTPRAVYWDERLQKYVAVDRRGRRYIVTDPYARDGYYETEETTLRLRSGDSPAIIQHHGSSETTTSGGGVSVKKD